MRTVRPLLAWLLVLMICGAIATTAAPDRALGAVTFVVNTTADVPFTDPSCSLRKAITAANSNALTFGCPGLGIRGAVPGPGDRIQFQLGNAGTPTINISMPLPAITEGVIIDGGPERVELHGPGGPHDSGQHNGLVVAAGATNTVIQNLVINNFPDDGIRIEADLVLVTGCFIGTDATGMMAVPNHGYGIEVQAGVVEIAIGGATSGGSCTGDCNLISGAVDGKANILLGLMSASVQVRGNFIGTNVNGTALIDNNAAGIIDKGIENLIGGRTGTTPGGVCTGDCNLISGNKGGGVIIDGAATYSVVEGNFIGTDVTGNLAIGNGGEGGVLTFAAGATVGGTASRARNVVSGNDYAGVEVHGLGSVVQGNFIGTNSAGMAAVPNGFAGVYAFDVDNALIGGAASGAGNIISGSNAGVILLLSVNTQILGNRIGTTADETTPLPNDVDGIFVVATSSQNVIGHPSAPNIIAFNGHNGVTIDGANGTSRGNVISGNSIHANGASGIELADGGNDDLAPPFITGAAPLHGTSCAPCTVEIYSDSQDEGRIYEGSVFSNDGNWAFNEPVSGPHITATNTDMSHNTSPFSAPLSLVSPTPSASPSPTATATRTHTGTATSTATASATSSRTFTAIPTISISATVNASRTATRSASSSATPTQTRTAEIAATSAATPATSSTASASRTATATSADTATASGTATATVAVSATLTPSPTLETTSTVTPTLAKPTPTATAGPCTGDCDGNRIVSIDELITGVSIALGTQPADACPALQNSDGEVDIAQLVSAVGKALNGCAEAAASAPAVTVER